MISIIDKFLINESIFHWARNSITNILGKRQLNRLGRGQLTSDDKIENSEKIQRRLTPKPNKSDKDLGFKSIRSYKHPVNLP